MRLESVGPGQTLLSEGGAEGVGFEPTVTLPPQWFSRASVVHVSPPLLPALLPSRLARQARSSRVYPAPGLPRLVATERATHYERVPVRRSRVQRLRFLQIQRVWLAAIVGC